VNPAQHMGGMLDDKKSEIYKMVPEEHLPKTFVTSSSAPDILKGIEATGISFPLIVKPDIGYKGYMVRKVDFENELPGVLRMYNGRQVVVQEFLNHAKEYSFLYYRIPHSKVHGITSLVEKQLPFVIGDGRSTLEELIISNSPFLELKYVLRKRKKDLKIVLRNGQKIVVDHVGNYSRGCKFYSLNSEIDAELVEVGRQFFTYLDGINFGRIDLKSDSLEELKKGNFKIMEVNGAKSEPLHIYDPKFGFFQIWKDIGYHWSILNKIVREQLRHSFHFPSAKDGIQGAKSLKRQMN